MEGWRIELCLDFYNRILIYRLCTAHNQCGAVWVGARNVFILGVHEPGSLHSCHRGDYVPAACTSWLCGMDLTVDPVITQSSHTGRSAVRCLSRQAPDCTASSLYTQVSSMGRSTVALSPDDIIEGPAERWAGTEGAPRCAEGG